MQQLQRLKSHGLFIGIFLVVAVLRLSPLFDYQFTYDEISALQRVDLPDFFSLVHRAIKIDAHPGLLQVLIYYIYQAAGPLTWLIKLPFILMSLGGLVYAYLFGLRNFSRQSGIAATVIFGFALIYVFHAPIARMYCAGIFFSLGLTFHFGQYVFRKNDSRAQLFFMGLFLLLCAFNHHLNALYAATLYLGGFFLLEKEKKKPYLICGAIVVLLYMPNIPITLYQLGVGGIGAKQGGWLEPPRLSALPELLNVLCGSGWGLAVFICLLLVTIIGGRQKGRWKRQFFLVAIFLINFLIVFLYSVLRFPIYQHTGMLFAGAGLMLAIASALESRSSLVNQVVILVLTVWLVNETYFRKDYLNQAVKTIFEYQYERTVYYKNVYGDKSVYPVFFESDSVMRRIYFGKYKVSFDCKINIDSIINEGSRAPFEIGGKKISPVLMFQDFVSKLEADYLILASAPVLHQALARKFYPYLIENRQTQAVHYKVYSRRESDKKREVPDDRILFDSKMTEGGTFTSSSHISENGFNVSNDNEFPYNIKGPYLDAVGAEGQVIIASAIIEDSTSAQNVEACISISDHQSMENFHYTAAAARDFLSFNGRTEVLTDAFIGNFHKYTDEKDLLNIYVWNARHEQFILRDLTFKVVDHWPKRWHFWD
jgi:hypothetical protein